MLGPWNCNPGEKIEPAMVRELVHCLESLRENTYVVFGEYELEPAYREHEFPIYRSSCGFIPSLSARSMTFDNQPTKGEWHSLSRDMAFHKSGIAIGWEKTNTNIDLQVVHPDTIHFDLTMLTKMVCGQNVSLLQPPHFTWSRANILATK